MMAGFSVKKIRHSCKVQNAEELVFENSSM